LTQNIHKTYSIIRDPEFAGSRKKLVACRKMLKKQGKESRSRASEALGEEIDQLWDTGTLGCNSPEVLQNTILFLLYVHMGM